jgi:hypothetical protein
MMTINASSVNSKSISYSLYSLFGLYALLYNPILVISGTGVIKPLVIIGAIFLIIRGFAVDDFRLIFSQLNDLGLSKTSIFLILYLGFVLLFGQFIAMFGGGGEQLHNIFLSVFSGLIPLTYLIVRSLPKSCNPVISLIAMSALIGALQALFIFLDWSYPAARALFSSIVIQPKSIEESFRAAGLTSITGDGLSFSQALCGGCAFYLTLACSEWRMRLFWLICFAAVFFSLMPVARTGVVIIFFFILLFMVFFDEKKKSIKTFFTLIIFILIVFLLNVLLLPEERLEFFFETILPYAFEFVFSYIAGNGFRSASTDELATMFVLPNDLSSWLFGDGYFLSADGMNYMNTDIGYLRILFYVGLVGSFLIYSWYFMIACACIHGGRSLVRRVFFAALLGSIFISNIKFPFVLDNVSIGFFLLFLFATHTGYSPGKIGLKKS